MTLFSFISPIGKYTPPWQQGETGWSISGQKIARLGLEGFDPVYAAEVEQLDKSVGRVMEKLRQMELEDNTLLIFTSDNGGLIRFTDNGPLRAGKGTFYEGGIRVPAVFRWPAVIQAGSISEYPVSGVDFMPTFAEMAGVLPPSRQPVDGLSLIPLLKGDNLPDRPIFFHFPLYLEGQEKERVLPVYGSEVNHWRAVPSSVVIQGDWKLIKYHEYGSHELFDLGSDISEGNDLQTIEKEKERALLDILQNWLNTTEAPIPHVPNEKFHSITPK